MSEHWAGMIIRYIDGNENRIAFLRPDDGMAAVGRIEEAIASKMLVLELEDRVLMIPFHNIKNIEIQPRPPQLPRWVLRNVQIVS